MTEFTGERVVPGHVDQDLWNEHLARYLFATRLCRGKRVLDVACGAGYGSAELARTAALVVGMDRSAEAIDYAQSSYREPHLRFLQASATAVPLRDASFDLVSAFELIEHLDDWQLLLKEARRLIAPNGQFIVSTPNKLYYAEARSQSGPNPFHAHEFEFDEFVDALRSEFPHVSLFVQNHANGVVFRPVSASTATDVRLESAETDPYTSHFFIAVCALRPQMGGPTFVYLPTAANVLREREHHIAMLDQEVEQKDAWLKEAQRAHQELLENHRLQTVELEARNRWAEDLNQKLTSAGERIVALQEELAVEQRSGAETAAAYEAKVAELDRECAARAQWAIDTEQRLTAELQAKIAELGKCAELLTETERTVEERTLWAQRLEQEKTDLEARLSMVQASRWYRMGRTLGLGPEVRGT